MLHLKLQICIKSVNSSSQSSVYTRPEPIPVSNATDFFVMIYRHKSLFVLRVFELNEILEHCVPLYKGTQRPLPSE